MKSMHEKFVMVQVQCMDGLLKGVVNTFVIVLIRLFYHYKVEKMH